MKVLPSASADPNSPKQPGNAANSSMHTPLRTGTYISGAFLFVAFVAGSVYAAAPASDDTKDTNAQSSTPSTSIHFESSQDEQAADTEQPLTTEGSTDESGDNPTNKGVSTSVTTVNGVTEVKVNGQTVQTPTSGSVNKTITTDNGTVNVNINQTDTGSGFNSSYVNYNSSSSSSNFNFNSEMNSGQ